MTTKLEKAIQQFNDLDVPFTQRFTTGPEESSEIGRIQDEYFTTVMLSLELSKRALASFFCVEHRVLGVEEPGSVVSRVTDDFDASFWLSEVQPLASVRNVRDVSNFQIILFTKYPLLPSSERELKWIFDSESGV